VFEKGGVRGVLLGYLICIPVGDCGGMLLKGNTLAAFYRNTKAIFNFITGAAG
jgi:hypothetical protein